MNLTGSERTIQVGSEKISILPLKFDVLERAMGRPQIGFKENVQTRSVNLCQKEPERTQDLLSGKKSNARVWWKIVIGKIENIDKDRICAMFQHIAKKWVFQEEISPSGFEHFQTLVCLTTKKRKTELIQTVANHLKCNPLNIQALISDKDFVAYCTKAETRVNGPWSKGFPGVMSAPPKLIKEEEFRPWQKTLVAEVDQETDDRTIIWYHDPLGSAGKTQLCKWLVHHRGAFVFGGKANDVSSRVVMMESDPKICICNIPRSHEQFVSYQSIEALKDGLVVTGKYEGGQKIFDSPHVIVFANFKPDMTQLSKDRWSIRELSVDLAPIFNLLD